MFIYLFFMQRNRRHVRGKFAMDPSTAEYKLNVGIKVHTLTNKFYIRLQT